MKTQRMERRDYITVAITFGSLILLFLLGKIFINPLQENKEVTFDNLASEELAELGIAQIYFGKEPKPAEEIVKTFTPEETRKIQEILGKANKRRYESGPWLLKMVAKTKKGDTIWLPFAIFVETKKVTFPKGESGELYQYLQEIGFIKEPEGGSPQLPDYNLKEKMKEESTDVNKPPN